MKSCLGLLITLAIFTAVLGGGALIWYLSSSTEFSRNPAPSANGNVEPGR